MDSTEGKGEERKSMHIYLFLIALTSLLYRSQTNISLLYSFPTPLHLVLYIITSKPPHHTPNPENTQLPGSMSIRARSGFKMTSMEGRKEEGKGELERGKERKTMRFLLLDPTQNFTLQLSMFCSSIFMWSSWDRFSST